MSKGQRVRDEMEVRYPGLVQFFGSYLHEDWPTEYSTPQMAVEAAIAEASNGFRRQVRQELADLLHRTADDVSLRKFLNRGFGVNVYFRKPAEARKFAMSAHDLVLDSCASPRGGTELMSGPVFDQLNIISGET
jgi:hypothetical protein